ncbi:HAMP domain-containing histidine kinase [Aquibacillus sp. 3ASR75-11]|uniref:histidine kinase n=1 Tax=Terrihalobacillus insolitus TaxID=2950438 RepID=A0A9X4AMD9_9BACI|nr:HAMP domain-containing sensor histidine kinase [Terrihalobacillus insolitus]MDC3423400.1 HAMP domain-containing histidine kinase [Terrihalobacillus insolitus]
MLKGYITKGMLIKFGLILLGISMPLWFGLEEIGLDDKLQKLRDDPTGNSLMNAAFYLVLLNTIRALPHYIGAFLLGEEIGELLGKRYLKIVIPFCLIPLAYVSINLYYPLNYNFGGPAILLLVSIIFLHILAKDSIKPFTKSFVLAQLLFGVQWLDTVVFLTSYGFGLGPVSQEVKSTAVQIEFDQTLSLYSLLLCIVFVVNSVILTVYSAVSEQKRRITQDLLRANMEAAESRSGREALHLVHDLKTPLSSIEGLNSLIKMKTNDTQIAEYTEHTSQSIQAISDMVSEILYEDRKKWWTLHELISYVRSNKIRPTTSVTFDFHLEADGDIQIFINKIRLTRAIVNLIDNACDAIQSKEDGQVTIHTIYKSGQVWIGVADNGVGLLNREKEKIWEVGYTTKSHPGIGMTFVKSVADVHGARLVIESKKGIGSVFWIVLPERSVQIEGTNY